mgnify:CR=1 FL=1
MNNQILVISFGNYEIKVLVGVKVNKKIIPLYSNSFWTNSSIINSKIENKIFLLTKLNEIFIDIKNKLNYLPKKTIFNIPLDELNIREKRSNTYIIKQPLEKGFWKKIFSEVNISNISIKNYYCIGKKVTKWNINGVDFLVAPYGRIGELSFNIQLFLIKKEDINCYLELFNELNFKNYEIVTDEIVMSNALQKNNFIEQAIINIGDKKTTISLYYNHSLAKTLGYDFGIKKLTSEISEIIDVNEEQAITMLKDYNDYILIKESTNYLNLNMNINDLPFAISFKKNIVNFNVLNLKKMNKIIKKWINELANIINDFSLQIQNNSLDIEELYIMTVANIFNYWSPYLKKELKFSTNCHVIDSGNDALFENKYLSLKYCLVHSELE